MARLPRKNARLVSVMSPSGGADAEGFTDLVNTWTGIERVYVRTKQRTVFTGREVTREEETIVLLNPGSASLVMEPGVVVTFEFQGVTVTKPVKEVHRPSDGLLAAPVRLVLAGQSHHLNTV